MKPKYFFLIFIVLFGSILMILDRLVYDHAVFGLKNHSGWDSFRWYNFAYEFKRLQRQGPAVLAVGSSVAQYSIQSNLLEKELSGQRVALLSHAALLPSDLYHYAAGLAEINPDLLVYIFNTADFDLERYSNPWEAGPLYSEKSAAGYLKIRHPPRYYYPLAFALHARGLDSFERSSFAIKGLFHGLRWAEAWREVFRFNLSAKSNKPLQRYLNFQGQPPPEGLFREGLTGGCFSISSGMLRNGKLTLQVPEELLVPELVLRVFEKGSSLKNCKPSGPELSVVKLIQSGWQEIVLPPGQSYFLQLSHVYEGKKNRVIRAEGPVWQGRGLRLPGLFGAVALPANDIYKRRRSLEDEQSRNLSPAEYTADFYDRLEPDDWRESGNIKQFNMLQLAKYKLNWLEFSETTQLRYLRLFLDRYPGPVLLVNNVESPLALDTYSRSEWYRNYLEYLTQLAKKHQKVSFTDLHNLPLTLQSFIDAHHLTYDGMAQMQPVYAGLIKENLIEQ